MANVDFNLYLITDRRQASGGDLIAAVHSALRGGVRAVQLREKDLSARDLLALARELRRLTREFGAKLLINDRIDVALAVEADGVHLGGTALPPTEARALLGPERLIGVSTHHPADIDQAAQTGADFVTFGPIYPTPSKAAYGAPVGLTALRAACSGSPLPIFALGGVTAERVSAILAAGCSRASCIGAILASKSPETAARDFLSQLRHGSFA